MKKYLEISMLSRYEAQYFIDQTKENFDVLNIEYDDKNLVSLVKVDTLTHDRHLTDLPAIAIASYLQVIYIGYFVVLPKIVS